MPKDSVKIDGVLLTREQIERAARELNRVEIVPRAFPAGTVVASTSEYSRVRGVVLSRTLDDLIQKTFFGHDSKRSPNMTRIVEIGTGLSLTYPNNKLVKVEL